MVKKFWNGLGILNAICFVTLFVATIFSKETSLLNRELAFSMLIGFDFVAILTFSLLFNNGGVK